jgi:serine/threonine-protein kinase
VEADLAQLVRESRFAEAGELASARGDARTASGLFERACDWPRAAEEGLRAGDAARALDLATRAGEDAIAERALVALASQPIAAEAAALLLERRGLPSWAARAWRVAGRRAEEAEAWERAGDVIQAADLHEQGGDVRRAAQVLDAALRRDPNDSCVAVALGALLARMKKDEAAVRRLQRVPADAPARRDALAHLVPALARLGLARASDEAGAELRALGGVPTGPDALRAGASSARLFGRYDPIREVASSPTARVLECVDVVRGDRVALKLFAGSAGALPESTRRRVEQDVQALAGLSHPNVVPLRAYFANGPAFAYAWMEGGTLDDWRRRRPVAPRRAAEVAMAVLSALGEAHRRGVVHRGVKPSNILFDRGGAARLSDFGAAHWGDVSITATAGVFGTLAYVSPEQREGRGATAQSDIFGVGVLLREMLTGERPQAIGPARVRPSQVHRGLGPPHDEVVERLSAPAPADRPPSAFEAHRLIAALEWPDEPAHEAVPTLAGAPSEPPSRAARLATTTGELAMDLWTGRVIDRVPLSDAVLARARAFASVDHPALQTVLRVDRDGGAVWLEACPGERLTRPLAPAERARLEEAIAALVGAGAGPVDLAGENVVLTCDGPVLRFRLDG